MNVASFLALLEAHPNQALRIVLPNGQAVAPHFHITEVGHVRKDFMDCGGTRRTVQSCVLQTWVFLDVQHRLKSDKLAQILRIAGDVLPSLDLPVEIEHEAGLISQYPLRSGVSDGHTLTLHTGSKHTACLATDLCCAPSTTAPSAASTHTAKPDTPARCGAGSGCC
jgi:hypothetical protein